MTKRQRTLETISGVIALAHVMAGTKELQVALDDAKDIWNRCQGNRSDDQDMTDDDYKQVFVAVLRRALELVEASDEDTHAAGG